MDIDNGLIQPENDFILNEYNNTYDTEMDNAVVKYDTSSFSLNEEFCVSAVSDGYQDSEYENSTWEHYKKLSNSDTDLQNRDNSNPSFGSKDSDKNNKEWADWHTKRANDAYEQEEWHMKRAEQASSRGDDSAMKDHINRAESWHSTAKDHAGRAKIYNSKIQN